MVLIKKSMECSSYDEVGGQQITEFVGLRTKLYSYKMDEGTEENIYPQVRQMNVIRSRLHNVFTETVNKVALSHKDNKRIISYDGINTYAHGYCNLILKKLQKKLQKKIINFNLIYMIWW